MFNRQYAGEVTWAKVQVGLCYICRSFILIDLLYYNHVFHSWVCNLALLLLSLLLSTGQEPVQLH